MLCTNVNSCLFKVKCYFIAESTNSRLNGRIPVFSLVLVFILVWFYVGSLLRRPCLVWLERHPMSLNDVSPRKTSQRPYSSIFSSLLSRKKMCCCFFFLLVVENMVTDDCPARNYCLDWEGVFFLVYWIPSSNYKIEVWCDFCEFYDWQRSSMTMTTTDNDGIVTV